MRSRKAFVLRLRRITIRRKEKNQTFDEEISQPGERFPTALITRQVLSRYEIMPTNQRKPLIGILANG